MKTYFKKTKDFFYNLYKKVYSFFWIGSFPNNPYLRASDAIEDGLISFGMSRLELREKIGKPTTIEQNAMGMPVLKYMQSYKGYTEWWSFTFSFDKKLLFYEYENDQLPPIEQWWKIDKWKNPTKRYPS